MSSMIGERAVSGVNGYDVTSTHSRNQTIEPGLPIKRQLSSISGIQSYFQNH